MSELELVQVGPHTWRFVRPQIEPARSELPMPHVISDIMEPTEQVDGKFYTSKSMFRKVGRQLGLTEVGNDKHARRTLHPALEQKQKRARVDALQKAAAEYRMGRRPKQW